MPEGQLPSNVHVLKPRTMSLSDRLDEFLETNALAPTEAPVRCDPTRPKKGSINAITCASCLQREYLSRDYCRCGNYLRGQLEEEYNAWERQKIQEYQLEVSLFEKKTWPARCLFAASIPFVVGPMLYLGFGADEFTLLPFAWVLLGFMLMCAAVAIEELQKKPVMKVLHSLEACDFQSFLFDRLKSN